ncbi:MAG: hypothetical protein EU544_06720 [Promethearchaeota archaeon]|nr:MAG: hypothetical protein EU544_06720 [Candidatus Lokiarchaeota archaeon]
MDKLQSISNSIKRLPENDVARILSILEQIEQKELELDNFINKKKNISAGYETYNSCEEMIEKLERLDDSFRTAQDEKRIDIGMQAAKIAIGINNWRKAINILGELRKDDLWERLSSKKKALISKNLGIALTKRHRKQYEQYETGRSFLEEAIELDPEDADAVASLGGTWKSIDDDLAYKYYKDSLKIDPANPYPLVNVLIYEIRKKNDLQLINKRKKTIRDAIQKRKEQAEQFIDIPWSYYDLGTLHLLLGDEENCVNYYLMAIKLSPDAWMIKTTYDTLNLLNNLPETLLNFKLIKSILLLGIGFHIKRNEPEDISIFGLVVEGLKDLGFEVRDQNLKSPLLIITGGIKYFEEKVRDLETNFIKALKDFKGMVSSGFLKYGIRDFIETITNALHLEKNSPYLLSKLDIIQFWFDVLNSDLSIVDIKLIGINGGRMSSLEYRMAIAFGIQVGIIKKSGRMASEFPNDPLWKEIVVNPQNQIPFRLYKLVENSQESIEDFMHSKFFKQLDNENLRLLVIQKAEGVPIYSKFFSNIPFQAELISGLITAIQDLSKEMGFGRVPIIPCEDGYFSATYFKNQDIIILFSFFQKPSDTLEKKIELFTKKCEEDLGAILREHAQNMQEYLGGPEMDDLLSDIFGSEIL